MATILDDRSKAVPASARTRLNNIWTECNADREARAKARLEPPLVRLWDGDWKILGRIVHELEGAARWKLNDTGDAVLVLPITHRLVPDLINPLGVSKSNVHLTVDKDGARWGGRMNTARLIKTEKGERYLELVFLHDYEELKRIYCWSNPLTPAALQFPRQFILAGPSAWVLKTTLMLNLIRLEGNLWALPDDPLDWRQWGVALNSSQWNIVVKPGPFITDSTPWTLVSSRFKSWHDLAEGVLTDTQLSVECRRYLDGDPEPWPGYRPRNGQLIVDVVDKSGWWSELGTSFFGSVVLGFVRTVQNLVKDTVDTQSTVVDTPLDTPQYEEKHWLGTVPSAPYVLYRDGAITGVQAASFTCTQAGAVQMLTGGKSAYGVNEMLSAGIQTVGNLLGSFVFPSAGTIADTLLRPLYTDTLLAWQSIKSTRRATALGWSHYHEYFADGADQGYTLSALLALRKAFWDTRQKVSHTLNIRDGAPWYVGDQGKGHFFIGDRIGATIVGLPEELIVVEQVTELEYGWSRTERGWTVTSGDAYSDMSGTEKIVKKASHIAALVHDLVVA